MEKRNADHKRGIDPTMIALLIALALVPHPHHPPRAASVMAGFFSGVWVCPELPNGRIIVTPDACFRVGYPEPGL